MKDDDTNVPTPDGDPMLPDDSPYVETDDAQYVAEFLGTIARRPGETDRAFEAFLATARHRPHTQRSPTLYQLLEIPQTTLYWYRKEHKWSERLAAWNDARAASERQSISSQRHDTEIAVANVARLLATKIGDRLSGMNLDEIGPGMLPQYINGLAKLIIIIDHGDAELSDGLLSLGDMNMGVGMGEDGLDAIVELATLDPALAEKVLAKLGGDKTPPTEE
jgi:hypothetical protein